MTAKFQRIALWFCGSALLALSTSPPRAHAEQFSVSLQDRCYQFELADETLLKLRTRAADCPSVTTWSLDAEGLYADRDTIFERVQDDLNWDTSILSLRKLDVNGFLAISQIRRDKQDLWLEIFLWPGRVQPDQPLQLHGVQILLKNSPFDQSAKEAASAFERTLCWIR